MRTTCLLLVLLIAGTSNAQLNISNGSFENMLSCPTLPGDVYKCADWQTVIESPDYLNCGFSLPAYPSPTLAFDGTGYMDFASSGDPNGHAEALGQNLAVPMAPGTYQIFVQVKKPTGGTYSANCGGVAVYGMQDTLGPSVFSTHASQLPGAVLLGSSTVVNNTAWQITTFSLTATATIRSLIFTNQQTPNCSEAIYMDAVVAGSEGHNSIAENDAAWGADIYPNPVVDKLNIRIPDTMLNAQWTLTDAAGREQRHGILRAMLSSIDLRDLHAGAYILQWTDGLRRHGAGRIIKATP